MGWFKTPEEKDAANKHRLNKLLFKGDIEKVRAALDAGADPNVLRNDQDYSALSFHAEGKRLQIVALLLERGARPDFGSSAGHTPLMVAARAGNLPLVTLLHEKGANLNAQSDSGWSALHNAAYWGRGPVIQYLMEHGADINLRDSRMNKAADIAAKEGYPRVAELLGGDTSEPEPESAATGWQKTAADEIALVSEKKEIGYRITEIFNFRAAHYTHIAANIKTGAESQHQRDFADFSETVMLREAMEALLSRGGRISADMQAKISGKNLPTQRGLSQGGH
ncbi:MAG: ankyrin repeat domain-containing protein [Alphaproteobacteria bacterium]|nr:ankyrin repeat domain-containing protein [Alphaproteobacteria bacterium]